LNNEHTIGHQVPYLFV